MVHIQHIHGIAFEKFHQVFSNRKIVILIAKGNSSSYNRFSQVSKEKVPLLCLILLYLYYKQNSCAAPRWPLAPPAVLTSQFCPFVSAHDSYKHYILDLRFKSTFMKRDHLGNWRTFPSLGLCFYWLCSVIHWSLARSYWA